MKIIVDMCLSPKWAEALREAGYNARHWSSLGPGNAPDSSIFAFARNDRCACHGPAWRKRRNRRFGRSVNSTRRLKREHW